MERIYNVTSSKHEQARGPDRQISIMDSFFLISCTKLGSDTGSTECLKLVDKLYFMNIMRPNHEFEVGGK
jgi:hypothetical protein